MFYSLDETIDIFSDKGLKISRTDLFMTGVCGDIKFYISVPLGSRAYSPNERIKLENNFYKELEENTLTFEQKCETFEKLRTNEPFVVDLCGYYLIPPKVILSLDNDMVFLLDAVINPEDYGLLMLHKGININKESIKICFKDIQAILDINTVITTPRTKTEIMRNYIFQAINECGYKSLELTDKKVKTLSDYCLKKWPETFTPPSPKTTYKGNFYDVYQGMKKDGLLINLRHEN